VRVAGIDPGTGSMDIVVVDDKGPTLVYERVVPRVEVTRDPGVITRIVDMLVEELGVEALAAPSGYGIPARYPGTLREAIAEATFVNRADLERSLQIHGLRSVMEDLASRRDVKVYFTPGVIHLPTVPAWRKANRIDMGTADKVFSVAAALWTEKERHGTMPGDATFILVEAGMAYTAAIAVEAGKIVDGVGGTSGHPGFLGLGSMDSELAYIMAEVEPGFSRQRLFQGGAATLAGVSRPEELARLVEHGDPRGLAALDMLAEAAAKDVAMLLVSLGSPPRRVYLSGRLVRDPVLGPRIRARLRGTLAQLGQHTSIEGVARLGAETKEAATGAALLASGYAGGRYRWIVESLRLEDSQGSLFDHIILPGVAEKARLTFTR